MTETSDQAAFWGGEAGQKWVRHQQMLDAQMLPVLEQVILRAGLKTGQTVLDVGCGTGQSTLMAAQDVGAQGHVLGGDISPPMTALARQRTQNIPQIAILETDVATHRFTPAQFDHVISRFGVMFFEDPVAAFGNIARAMKPGAQLTCAAWGRIEANPWFTLPARIAKAEVGVPPKSNPDAPGPFAFRDITKVENILSQAGFRTPQGTAEEVTFTLPNGATDFAALTVEIGPAAGTLDHFNAPQTTRDRVQSLLASAFAELPNQAVPGEINYFTATAP